MDLFNSDKLLQFWPSSKQSYSDRVDAAARFIIYASFIAYMLRRDNRIIGVATFILIIIFLFKRSNQQDRAASGMAVEVPKEESFFPDSRWTTRQFYTVPDTSDLDGFLKFAYGKDDNCRTNPEMCDPDNNPRMVDQTQRRAFTGGANYVF